MAAARPIIQLIIVSAKEPDVKGAGRGRKFERPHDKVGSALALSEIRTIAGQTPPPQTIIMSGYRIARVESADDLETVVALFQRYAASLPVVLDYQDFNSELADLPGKYASPGGCLLLARDETGEGLGCVGLRSLQNGEICEMKRLYLLPSSRGMGLGRALAKTLIDEARDMGYSEMRLDTLPSMSRALSLYERLGFRPIEPYYAPTPTGTTFMALAL